MIMKTQKEQKDWSVLIEVEDDWNYVSEIFGIEDVTDYVNIFSTPSVLVGISAFHYVGNYGRLAYC